MTDLLTTALRELESDAPDTDATREAVYQGIQTRARHRRMATVGAAGLTVVVLAAGAYVVATELGHHKPRPPQEVASRLMPVPRPQVRVNLKVPDSISKDRMAVWTRRGDMTEVTYAAPDPTRPLPTVTIGSGRAQPDAKYASPHLADTTVQGRPALLRTYAGEEQAELMWETANDEVRWVVAETTASARDFADKVTEETTSGRPPISVGLLPESYELAGAQWESLARGAIPSTLHYCPSGNLKRYSSCYLVTEYPGQVHHDGEESDGYCERGPGEHAEELSSTWGPARKVKGAMVWLSSDGCHAARKHGNDLLLISAPAKSTVPPEEFARMAASIQVYR